MSASRSLENYVVLDLETTGLDLCQDEIIEVAAIRVENGVIVDRFQSLVNPRVEVSEFITDLTGITNDMLATAPVMSDVLPRFIQFIGDSIVVAHNANFDVGFLCGDCLTILKTAFSNPFVDTMQASRGLFGRRSGHKLSDLVERCGIGGNVEHRAMSDVINTFKCFEYLKNYVESNNFDILDVCPIRTISEKQTLVSSYKSSRVNANTIKTTNAEFDKNSLVFEKVFVFTGDLERMQRKEAMQVIVDMGGMCGNSVTRKTNYLVLGNNDACPMIKDGKSTKQKKAEQLKLSGNDINIISESVFCDMLAS